MRRFLQWILMVLLMIALIVGGSLGFLYLTTNENDMPGEHPLLGETALEPNGYEWDLPILGGALYKNYASAPSLGAQDLGTVDQQGAALHLPAWATDAEIKLECDGQTLYSGDAEGYANFAWPADGSCRLYVTVKGNAPDARPAKPLGWYSYTAKFQMQRTLTATLSADKLPQGSVFAIYVQGGDPEVIPTAQCDLGNVWFAPYAAGWLGFLPAAHNAESGVYPLQVTVGDRTLPLQVEVTFRQYGKAGDPVSGDDSEEAAQEYRKRIWPLYNKGEHEKRWTGSFTQPAQGDILLDYGAYIIEGGRSSGLTISPAPDSDVLCPAPGQVVFSGPLLLTGNTLVVEHGCGVKSYFYHLDELLVPAGDTLTQGQVLGKAGSQPLIYELKIGNKSIDPWAAFKGTSGLFFTPRFDA